MGREDGWAAIQLEAPKRIPRIEFDAQAHWALVTAVTGRKVAHESPPEEQKAASNAFVQAWDYAMLPSTHLHAPELDACRTHMGHAVYADGGVDYEPELKEAFTDPEDALRFDPWEAFGEKDHDALVARFQAEYARMEAEAPFVINSTGTYITLLTGAIYIFGWDMLLMMAGLDPDGFGALLGRYREWMQQYYDALAETDAPLIASHDDIVWTAGAIFEPAWYRKYIFPNLTKLYEPLKRAGKKVLFLSDGDYTEFIDDIAETGADGFFMEPLTDMQQVADRYGQTHFFIGNADTRILLSGDRAAIRKEVERCIAIGRECPGYFCGVTNMIPHNTPVESALYYNDVFMELRER